MAWGIHVSVDSTVSSVGSTSASLGLVALNVSQDELVDIEGLGLRVRNEVLQKTNYHLGGLLGPATLSVLELFGLSSSPNTTVESTERDASLLLDDGVQVFDSISNSGASDGGADFEGILEVNSDVRTSCLAS